MSTPPDRQPLRNPKHNRNREYYSPTPTQMLRLFTAWIRGFHWHREKAKVTDWITVAVTSAYRPMPATPAVLTHFPIEASVEERLFHEMAQHGELGFEHLIHPTIEKSSYKQYFNGHFRDAVLNSVVAVFDYIRSLTGIDADGDALVNKAFSLDDPFIILSELTSESGRNDQKGFMQIFRGAFQGIRDPAAHSLSHDLTAEEAAQYLIFASLLVRRLERAKIMKTANKE